MSSSLDLIVIAPHAADLPALAAAFDADPAPALRDWLRPLRSASQAEAAWAGLPERLPARCVLTAVELLPALDLFSSRWPALRWVFVHESAASSLARELELGPVDLGAWSAAWAARHRELLRQLQRQRVRSQALLLDELRSGASALGAACEALGLPAAGGAPVAWPSCSSLSQLLAAELLATDVAVKPVAEEWVAACLPLPRAAGAMRALDEWRALCAAARALSEQQQALALVQADRAVETAAAAQALQKERDDRAAELRDLRDDLAQQQLMQQAIDAELSDLRDALAARGEALAAAEAELAVRAVAVEAATRDAASALTASQAAQQKLESAQREMGLLSAQLQDLQRQLGAQLTRERDASRQQQQQQAAAQQRLESELDAQRARGQQMLVDIQRLQDALCDEHELALGLAARAELGAEPLLARLRRLHRAGESTTPPHLGLDLWLEALQLGDRQVERQTLRLVQHHGRAGLALFRADGDAALLSSWQPQGREEAGDFMLLVPEDEPGQQCLAQLPTSDWLRLQALLALLRAELVLEPGLRDTRWPGVVLQLQRLLAESAPRLRYDGLQVSAEADTLSIQLDKVLFGQRRHERLQLRWSTGGDAPLQLLYAGANGDPAPLARWPRQDDGTAAAQQALPLGQPAAAAIAAWQTLPMLDRGLVLGLLDLLPAALAASPAGAPTSALQAALPSLQAQAAHLQAGSPGRWRRLARRLARRFG